MRGEEMHGVPAVSADLWLGVRVALAIMLPFWALIALVLVNLVYD
jgi:hypothetical protein